MFDGVSIIKSQKTLQQFHQTIIIIRIYINDKKLVIITSPKVFVLIFQ